VLSEVKERVMATTPRRRSAHESRLDGNDPRAGETPSQDIAPTDEDIRLEAALVERREHTTNIADWSKAVSRLQQGDGVQPPQPTGDEAQEAAADEEDAADEDVDEDEDEDDFDDEADGDTDEDEDDGEEPS
jgi:hypothetical protein